MARNDGTCLNRMVKTETHGSAFGLHTAPAFQAHCPDTRVTPWVTPARPPAPRGHRIQGPSPLALPEVNRDSSKAARRGPKATKAKEKREREKKTMSAQGRTSEPAEEGGAQQPDRQFFSNPVTEAAHDGWSCSGSRPGFISDRAQEAERVAGNSSGKRPGF